MANDTHSKNPNRLAKESSPYLLQHAYNPVDWYPWGEEALKKAKDENKPILVSIGYSACHWCHVMERECFENEEIADIMNKHYVCIKVDREERPDIDQIYMDALQSMNIRGGWPLNAFLTSEAKPFYGGTYFPPMQWIHLLSQISVAYKEQKTELEKSADEFTRVLNYSEVVKYGLQEESANFTLGDLEEIFPRLENKFDKRLGGTDKSPKFPMPSIYLFLLRYFHITKNESALKQVKLTLDKMAYGGIYDQIGGGFARYSVDEEWFAPHFEKMLYDNGQLMSLYSEAYSLTKSPMYKEVVYDTNQFIQRELMSEEGGFYSALDADSEGIEGKFYIWTYDEIEKIIQEDTALFCEYYNVQANGNWEHDYNILNRSLSDLAFANKHKIEPEELKRKIEGWKLILLKERSKKIRPGLDDKILASWNGLMLKGLVDSYRVFGEKTFLDMALKNANFIQQKMRNGDKLFHSYKSGKASIDGYLEDYGFVMQGYLALYQATFEESWLMEANNLAEYVLEHFYDATENMFFFTADNSERLIARKKEIFDNVIPASNSVIASNFHLLGLLLDHQDYKELAIKMLGRVKKLILAEPGYLANWGCLLTSHVKPIAEVVISGKDYLEFRKMIDQKYNPNIILAGTMKESSLPLLEGRSAKESETTIYVCYDKTCKLPVTSVEEALELIE